MTEVLKSLQQKGIKLPADIINLLENAKSVTQFNFTEEIMFSALVGRGNSSFSVDYEVKGKGIVTEAIVHRVSNGIAANYPEPYMRRRDPDTMFIADELPTNK